MRSQAHLSDGAWYLRSDSIATTAPPVTTPPVATPPTTTPPVTTDPTPLYAPGVPLHEA